MLIGHQHQPEYSTAKARAWTALRETVMILALHGWLARNGRRL